MNHQLLASTVNPFDKSYHYLQRSFDRQVVQLLSKLMKLNLTLLKNPLITDLAAYERNPDVWVLEQIVNGSAEISSTSLILTPDTPNWVHYSFGIGIFRPQLYYRATSLREDNNIYLIPFSPKVWIGLIGIILLLTTTLIFILSREAKLPHKISYDVVARIMDLREERDEDWTEDLKGTSESLRQREKWEVGEILLVCLGAVCQQGSARDPSTSAARLLLLVLFVLAAVTYTAYSASIISLISLFPSTEDEQIIGRVESFSRKYPNVLHHTNKMPYLLEKSFKNIEFTSLKMGLDKAIKGEAIFVGDRDVSLTVLNQQKYNENLTCALGRVFLGMEYHRVLALKNTSLHIKKLNINPSGVKKVIVKPFVQVGGQAKMFCKLIGKRHSLQNKGKDFVPSRKIRHFEIDITKYSLGKKIQQPFFL